MRSGNCFCLSISRLEPNWAKDFNNEEFPSDLIFNNEEWRRYANYMKIVKPDENKNMQGDAGMFSMQKNFKLCILASYVDDEQMKRVMDSISHLGEFKIFVSDKEHLDLTLNAKQAYK